MTIDLEELERLGGYVGGPTDAQYQYVASRTFRDALAVAAPALFAELRELRAKFDVLSEHAAFNLAEVGVVLEQMKSERDSLRAELAEYKERANKIIRACHDAVRLAVKESYVFKQENEALRAEVERLKAQLATAHDASRCLRHELTEAQTCLTRNGIECEYTGLEKNQDGTVREGTK